MSKRTQFAWLSTMLVVALLVSACSGTTPVETKPAAPAPAPTPKAVTINFTHWRADDQEVFKKIAEKFRAETNITVEQTIAPSTNYSQAVSAAVLSGDSGDVFAMFAGAQFVAMAKSGAYADLGSEKFLGAFDATYLGAGKWDGKQLAVPYQLVYPGPVYNVDMMKSAGITEMPKDWAGFMNVCKTLKSKNITPVIFIGAVSADHFFNYLVTNNAPNEDFLINVETKKSKLTDPWFVRTLTQVKELADAGCFQDGAAATAEAAGRALFAQEKGAIFASGSWELVSVHKLNDKLNLAQMAPVADSADKRVWEGIHSATFLLGVNAKSKKLEAAKQWIAYLARPENATEYTNATGQGVSVKGVSYNSAEGKYLQQTWAGKKTRQQPRFTGTMPETLDVIRSAMLSVVSKQQSPEAAAAEAQKTLEPKLK